jgi:glycosyltransferase involved in cell wall biosynthesis
MNMAHYRVLVVTNLWPTPADPGFGSFVQDQMESLRPLGIRYEVFFVDGRESRWNYLRAYPELWRRIGEHPFDLIHAHFGLAGLVARGQVGLPLVVTFHGDDVLGQPTRSGHITLMGRFFQMSSFLLAPMASAVIVQSREMRSKLKLASARVIPCGIDLDLFRPYDLQETRLALGLDLKKKYVLFAYNPAEPRKRFDLIEAAVAEARQQIPELEILHVRGKPHSDMPRYMSAADVLVLASLAEGGPLVTKEAMATGLPVISVNVGDAVDLIHESDGNFLVPREAQAIAQKIVQVCRSGKRSGGREWLHPYSMPMTARKILEVYEDVLQHKTTRNGAATSRSLD